jgi:hypothetical protein
MMSAYSCSSCTTSLHRVICEPHHLIRTLWHHHSWPQHAAFASPCSRSARNVEHRSIQARVYA